jgi:Ca2+-binding RTX toxin-like protein
MSEDKAKNKKQSFIDLMEDNTQHIDNDIIKAVKDFKIGDVVGGAVLDWVDWTWGDNDDVKTDFWHDSDLHGYSGNDILYSHGLGHQKQRGGDGKDILFAIGTTTDLAGGNGDDLIMGFAAYNDISGGDGDDYIAASGGDNDISGGSGRDIIVASGVDNWVDGDGGADKLIVFGVRNVVHGGDGDDKIRSLGGSSTLKGQDGDDEILGLGGHNEIEGGAGRDDIEAGGLYNEIDGGSGADDIKALAGLNTIWGGDGDDFIKTGGGSNVVYAGQNADTVLALGANNWIEGGGGGDELIAVGGANEMFGGSGRDTLVGIGAANLQYGEGDDDTMVAVGLSNLQWGGSGADNLFALGGLNVQMGEGGNDILIAGGAANLQHGGSGGDWLVGGAGGNIQIAASDDDFLLAGGAGNVQFGDGVSDIAGFLLDISGLADVVLWDNAKAEVNDGMDTVGAEMAGLVATLETYKGYGDAGDDVLFGGGKGNLQVAGGGDNHLFGGGRVNLQTAGGGNDLAISAGQANIQHTEGGNDVLVSAALGLGNGQFAGAGDDVLIGFAKGTGAAAQVQHADAGNDLLFGYTATKKQGFLDKLKAYKGIADTAKEAQSTGDYSEVNDLVSAQAQTMAQDYAATSMTVQVGGEGADVFVGAGDLGVQLGGGGDDIALLMDGYSLATGGAGGDLLITGGTTASLAHGGAGSDWIIGTGTLALFLAHSNLQEATLESFASAVDSVSDPLASALNTIDEIQETLEALNPFADEVEQVQQVIAETMEWFDLSTNQYVGGNWHDVLAGGAGDAHLIGGKGDDTYLFTFGAGDSVVDEAGFDAALDWADKLDLDASLLSDLTGGASGTDTLELRGWGWTGLGVENLTFKRLDTDAGQNLKIGFQTAEGAGVAALGGVTIKNMDDAGSQIEYLRIFDGVETETYDLAAAFADADFGVSDSFDFTNFLVGSGTGSGLNDDFVTEWNGTASEPGWGKTLEDAFGLIPGSDTAFETAGGYLEDAVAFVEPTAQGFFETLI